MTINADSQERWALTLLVFLVAFVKIGFFLPVFSDGDTWWHLSAGRWIWLEYRIPSQDPFSFSRAGAPWHAHEWLAEVVMWGVFKAGGWNALITLTATAAAGSIALLCYFLQRWLPPISATLITTVVALSVVEVALVRPHVLALPILLIWVMNLILAREKHSSPSWWLALLMVLWANLHGSFLLGLLLVGPFAAEAVLEEENRRQALLQWAAFAALAALAAITTPFGLSAFYFPLQVSSMETLPFIAEWRQTTVSNSPAFYGILLTTVLFFLVQGVRLKPLRAGLFVLFLGMALAHQRHQFIFAPIAALLVAEPIARTLKPRPQAAGPRSAADRLMLLLLLVGTGLAVSGRLLFAPDLPSKHGLPTETISRLPDALKQAPVFNDYSFGGPLIFFGIKPFIDGRADMYGDDFLRAYLEAEDGNEGVLRRIVDQHRIRWAILAPKSPAEQVLRTWGWRSIHSDKKASLLIHPEQQHEALSEEAR